MIFSHYRNITLFMFLCNTLFSSEILEHKKFENILLEMYINLFSPLDIYDEFIPNPFKENLSSNFDKKLLLDPFDKLLKCDFADSPDKVKWMKKLTILLR